MSYCRTDIMGHVANTPELKETKDGKPYAKYLVIANIKKDKATPMYVTSWGYGAQQVADAGKGALVCASGDLESWRETDDDPVRYSLNANRGTYVPRQPEHGNRKEYKDNGTSQSKGQKEKEDDLPF